MTPSLHTQDSAAADSCWESEQWNDTIIDERDVTATHTSQRLGLGVYIVAFHLWLATLGYGIGTGLFDHGSTLAAPTTLHRCCRPLSVTGVDRSPSGPRNGIAPERRR